ncbi:MAG: adenylate/guanylate cyclase domain-containing protein [Bacteroidota bacterium]
MRFILIGTSLGVIYPIFSDGFEHVRPFINGAVTGIIGAICIAYPDLYLFPKFARKLKLYQFIFLKTFFYFLILTLLLFLITISSRMIQFGMSFQEVIASEEYQLYLTEGDFPYALFFMIFISFVYHFTLSINRKLGKGVLYNMIIGRYRQPKEEERIFMFLDLNSSTSIAEKLDNFTYHNLLFEFYSDISESILATKGDIYQYVGDEVVVSWKTNKLHNYKSCVDTYFLAKAFIQKRQEKYQQKYGLVPGFKAAFHAGRVILGEIGVTKSDIVFHGDVMNTTARIEKKCSDLGKEVLVSKNLLDKVSLPATYKVEPVGNIALRGKSQSLPLYSIEPTISF